MNELQKYILLIEKEREEEVERLEVHARNKAWRSGGGTFINNWRCRYPLPMRTFIAFNVIIEEAHEINDLITSAWQLQQQLKGYK